MNSPIIPLHLGALHPVEQVLTLVLAFGPFAVLGVVIVLRRRGDAAEDDAAAAAEQTAQPADPAPEGAGSAADPAPGQVGQER